MLSVLIPTYHYNTLPLVVEIQKQCDAIRIEYEIIVLDDGSTDLYLITENEKINQIPNCHFEQNFKNYGRATNMNLLASKAKNDWLLFMDCDTFPKNDTFIKTYVDSLKKNTSKIFFGGICYSPEKPEKSKLLRWKYGKKREEISLQKRLQNPYGTTLTSNILIPKSVFEKIQFNQKITEYGYEDLVFIANLKQHRFEILPIDNGTYHLNYETSCLFIAKTKKALETLLLIEDLKLVNAATKLQKAFYLLRQYRLLKAFNFIYTKTEQALYKNLVSGNPNIILFDIYKLGYFCKIKTR